MLYEVITLKKMEEWPKSITYTKPDGGLFIWVDLPKHMNAVDLFKQCVDAGVAYVPGVHFFPEGGHENTMRLNFVITSYSIHYTKLYESASAVSVKDDSLSPGQVLKDPRFYIITFSLMLACMGGLMMIGFAKPIAVAKGLAETATIGVLA